MNKTKGLFFTASLVLALTLTQSCSGDDGGGGGGDPSSSSGGETQGGGDPSSSSNGGQGGFNACTNLEPVTIGSQKWAKKNLDCEVGESKCYENNSANCTKYGRLYDWNTAKTACPSGWRLPTNEEWDILENVGYDKLKATSGWNNTSNTNRNGTDDFGFTALPGGAGLSDGSFRDVGEKGLWWSAYEVDSDKASGRVNLVDPDPLPKSYLLSIRCIKD